MMQCRKIYILCIVLTNISLSSMNTSFQRHPYAATSTYDSANDRFSRIALKSSD